MELLTQIKATMIANIGHQVALDKNSKVLFKEGVTALKSFSNLKEGITALNKIADELLADKAYKNRVKKTIHYSSIAVDTNLFINIDKLNWYNAERALKLMEHLNEHYTQELTKVKNKLNKLRRKDSECTTVEERRSYNDDYASALAEYYKEYKLEDDEETKGVKITKVFESLSAEGQAKLLAKLIGSQKVAEVA